MKMEMITYLDTILVPLSLFVLIAYHAYLWLIFKSRPSHTTMGIESLRRRIWFLDIEVIKSKFLIIVHDMIELPGPLTFIILATKLLWFLYKFIIVQVFSSGQIIFLHVKISCEIISYV